MKKGKKSLNKERKKEKKMGLFGSGGGFLGLPIQTQRSFLNGLGLGMIALGLYFLFAYFEVIPFSPRFEDILDTPNELLIASITSIIIGGLINEKIKEIVREVLSKF